MGGDTVTVTIGKSRHRITVDRAIERHRAARLAHQYQRKTPDDNDNKRSAFIKDYYFYNEYHKKINDENIKVDPRSTPTENPRICIIGAGMTGLFSALLLKKVGINDITILEYQNRVGGRVHTHYFTDSSDDDRRLYGELGAMRLPYIQDRPDFNQHQLVFDVIDYLNEYNEKDDSDREIKLIPFINRNPNALYYFNNKKTPSNEIMTNNYSQNIGVKQLGLPDEIPDNYLNIWSDAVQPFYDELDANFTNGLINLKRYDNHTVYSYLKEIILPKVLPSNPADYDEIIDAIETQEVGTGGYHHYGLVTFIIDSYSTSNPNFEVIWKTIDKGMQRLPNAFLPIIKKENINLTYNSEVYKLEKINDGKIEVYWKNNGKSVSEIFDRVIVTVPLGLVRHWDLPLTLSYGKRSAIREMDYGFAGKIFLQFKSRFWEKPPSETGANPTTSNVGIIGGITYTDLPIRTLVYPSYYQNISSDNPGILLASYTWSNDAIKYGQFSEEERFELALKNLAIIHGDIVYKEWIPGKKNNKAQYWPNDRTSGGAYAEFGVSQFVTLMGAMMRSEEFIHWGGEHTDIHCAWIVGALNSGIRVVKEILLENLMSDRWSELKDSRLLKYWNGNLNAFEGY
ncbi:24808_t:CDS:2 [Cetraspora pellucida]|uniref:24808_t:CDS:1 n=1 Tax=Cetraspora pellucida TaxID=1433469 RepID=A0A9N9ARK7_9GLOM|nr:24808_t:CDS:2 [Cetraspora pellucida]